MTVNWEQLKGYVNEGRTRAQLERVARTIGINPDAKGNLLLHNINRRIESRIKSEGPEAISGFTPPNNRSTNGNHLHQRQRAPRNQNPPKSPPVPPAQTPLPTGLGGNFLTNGGIWQLLVAATAVAVIVMLAFWAYDNLTDDDDGGNSPPTSSEASPTTAPSPTPTATLDAGGEDGDVSLIGDSASDKPEPTYKTPHRQPEKDFNVKCDKTFLEDTRWLLCEPGALQTEVGSFRWPEAEGVTYRSNCPEGFMWYGSMGQGKITTESSTLVMQPENGLNYLVVIRCPLNDGKVDSDRNLSLTISDIVVGHAGWTPVDALGGVRNPEDAAYVSMEWFGEQLVVSGTKSGTNCGATGCSRTIVVLHDVDSGLHERYLVTNVKGETNDADNDGIEDYQSATWEKIYTNAR